MTIPDMQRTLDEQEALIAHLQDTLKDQNLDIHQLREQLGLERPPSKLVETPTGCDSRVNLPHREPYPPRGRR